MEYRRSVVGDDVNRNNCIDATRLVCDSLAEFDVVATPMSVEVRVSHFRQGRAIDTIAIQNSAIPGPNEWAGHLVALIEPQPSICRSTLSTGTLLLDLSADQLGYLNGYPFAVSRPVLINIEKGRARAVERIACAGAIGTTILEYSASACRLWEGTDAWEPTPDVLRRSVVACARLL